VFLSHVRQQGLPEHRRLPQITTDHRRSPKHKNPHIICAWSVSTPQITADNGR